ncbi:hypothetical protein Acsp01_20630 [Actinoplanes sp. NBRC 101535]|nr:hypothetical protein Acsp01_20630 [Actinoplanes sp. NBRC 101535]
MIGAYCLTYYAQVGHVSVSNAGREARMRGPKASVSVVLNVSAAVLVNFAAAEAG